VVGVIADGIHVHPALVDVTWKAKRLGRVNLVTDAIGALGMPPGTYRLGHADVTSDGVEARLADGTLAGCVLNLAQAVRNLVEFTGCHPAEAINTVTAVPATLLGEPSGRIKPGCRSDLTLLTGGLQIMATIVAGEVVYST
jgi:N-acetylglucosamine-6-phosphate deacetylase